MAFYGHNFLVFRGLGRNGGGGGGYFSRSSPFLHFSMDYCAPTESNFMQRKRPAASL